MDSNGVEPVRYSILKDIRYFCTISHAGYRCLSEAGQVRLRPHYAFSSHAHARVRSMLHWIKCRWPHYVSYVCDKFSNATGCVFCVLRCSDKINTTIDNIWSRPHLCAQVTHFSFPTILPTADCVFCSSVATNRTSFPGEKTRTCETITTYIRDYA